MGTKKPNGKREKTTKIEEKKQKKPPRMSKTSQIFLGFFLQT